MRLCWRGAWRRRHISPVRVFNEERAMGTGAAGAGGAGLASTVAGVAGRRLAAVEAGGYRVIDATYADGLALSRHTHPRPSLSFVSRGSFQETNRWGVTVCSVGAMHVRPSEEPHAN